MVPSKAEERIIEQILSGRGPVTITESKENVVDSAEEIAKRQRLADAERDFLAETDKDSVNSSDEISKRQRLAAAERDLATSLRSHTPTTDEANDTTTESSNLDSLGKGR